MRLIFIRKYDVGKCGREDGSWKLEDGGWRMEVGRICHTDPAVGGRSALARRVAFGLKVTLQGFDELSLTSADIDEYVV